MPFKRTANRITIPLALAAIPLSSHLTQSPLPDFGKLDEEARNKELRRLSTMDFSLSPKQLKLKAKTIMQPSFRKNTFAKKFFKEYWQEMAKYQRTLIRAHTEINSELFKLDKEFKDLTFDEKSNFNLSLSSPSKYEKLRAEYEAKAREVLGTRFAEEKAKATKDFRKRIQRFADASEGKYETLLSEIRTLNNRYLALKANCAEILGLKLNDLSNFKILNEQRKPIEEDPSSKYIFKLANGDEAMWLRYSLDNPLNGSKAHYDAILNLDKKSLLATFVDNFKLLIGDSREINKDYKKAALIYEETLKPILEKNGQRLLCAQVAADEIRFTASDKSSNLMHPTALYYHKDNKLYSGFKLYYEGNGASYSIRLSESMMRRIHGFRQAPFDENDINSDIGPYNFGANYASHPNKFSFERTDAKPIHPELKPINLID